MNNKMELIKNGAEFFKIWNSVGSIITSDRFFHLCERCDVKVPGFICDRQKQYEKFCSFYTCMDFPPNLIEAALNDLEKLSKKPEREINRPTYHQDYKMSFFVKIIYKLHGKIKFSEVDLFFNEGIDHAARLHHNAEKIFAQCRLCDCIYYGHGKENLYVYENDIVHCRDINNKSILVTCFYPGGLIHPAPEYRELLYSVKYGYLNSEGAANIDKEQCGIDKSMLNLKSQKCCDYLIKLNDSKDANTIGNLSVDLGLLKSAVGK